ncbi:hypothetical protein B0T22DRAFT_269850 [Podospora appendiculata]|uniref:Uncharacterized protein n=1 Tax=Podospora appendiculata TaxID=314037 RepID=A0AAE1C9I4_9PEZI|nr:hypothetical protein B0T22DRAFT_269850 [Podospora appendiculata]
MVGISLVEIGCSLAICTACLCWACSLVAGCWHHGGLALLPRSWFCCLCCRFALSGTHIQVVAQLPPGDRLLSRPPQTRQGESPAAFRPHSSMFEACGPAAVSTIGIDSTIETGWPSFLQHYLAQAGSLWTQQAPVYVRSVME